MKKYKLISANSNGKFEELLNEAIKNGYKKDGELVVVLDTRYIYYSILLSKES